MNKVKKGKRAENAHHVDTRPFWYAEGRKEHWACADSLEPSSYERVDRKVLAFVLYRAQTYARVLHWL